MSEQLGKNGGVAHRRFCAIDDKPEGGQKDPRGWAKVNVLVKFLLLGRSSSARTYRNRMSSGVRVTSIENTLYIVHPFTRQAAVGPTLFWLYTGQRCASLHLWRLGATLDC